MAAKTHSIFDPAIIVPAIGASFKKLNPVHMVGNPVMFVTEVGALITTVLLFTGGQGASVRFPPPDHSLALVHRALRELRRGDGGRPRQGAGRDAAQSEDRDEGKSFPQRWNNRGSSSRVSCRKGDLVVVKAGEFIPGDGEIIEGAATVDESAITGESAPVVREAGGDRSAVTGGTRVLSDVIKVRITANPGETFLDRMIGLVEGAKRQKTPNEIALTILLSALTIIFLIVLMSMKAFGIYQSVDFSITVLVALLVCLIPTTIGGLLSAIGIAGIDRLVQKNVLAMSGRAVEAAGDVDVLLLDKTGTITLGNRQATEFIPAPGVTKEAMAEAAQLASLADETPEGRSIVVLAKEKYGLRGRELHELPHAIFVPFTAQTRMSGVDINGTKYRKGAADQVKAFAGGNLPDSCSVGCREDRRSGRHAARRRLKRESARHDLPQGHRQRRTRGSLRAFPRHGHSHHHDHG